MTASSWSARFDRLPPATRGAIYMIAAGAAFAVMMAMVRLLATDGVHPFVSAFFRNLLGLVFLVPWVARAGFRTLRTGHFGMHGLRAAFGLGAMLCLFTALSRLPLAEVQALTFTAPLFATAGAAAFLKEQVRARRWTATLIGLGGALVVLRPGLATIQPAALLALASAAFMSGAMLTIKSLSRTEHPNAIVFMMGALMTPASLVPAVLAWTPPPPASWGWLVLMGLSATIGQVLLTRAFQAADASLVMSFGFMQLVFVALLGYLLFGEAPDLWTWIGAVIIIASTAYIARREAHLAGRAGRKRPPSRPL